MNKNTTLKQHLNRIGTFSLLFLATLALLTGCKASVEGETENWSQNTAMMANLKTEYSGYEAPLSEIQTQAEAAWKEAEGISDEEKKIEAMVAANDIIDESFASKLSAMPGIIDKVWGIRDKLAGKSVSNSLYNKMSTAGDRADDATDDAHDVMDKSATTIAEASALVDPVYDELKSVQMKWEGIERDYKKENKPKKKKKRKK